MPFIVFFFSFPEISSTQSECPSCVFVGGKDARRIVLKPWDGTSSWVPMTGRMPRTPENTAMVQSSSACRCTPLLLLHSPISPAGLHRLWFKRVALKIYYINYKQDTIIKHCYWTFFLALALRVCNNI